MAVPFASLFAVRLRHPSPPSPIFFLARCAAARRLFFFFSRAYLFTCAPFASRAQGGANSIKAQQIEFQALKKASGNTHTARGMPMNLFALAFIGVGGTMMMCNTLRKLYWGVGKIVLKDE